MKSYSLIITLSLSLLIPVFAQEKVDLDMIYNIKNEGLKNSHVMDIAHHLTDVSGPRLTGSTGLKNASEWAKNQLEEWGLQNAELEKWGEFGKGWVTERVYVAMTEPYYQPLIGMAKAWTPGTNGEIKAEVIRVEASTVEDLDKYKGQLKGKIVLMTTITNLDNSWEANARRFTDEELEEKGKQQLSSRSSRSPERIAEWRARREVANKMNQFVMEEGALAVLSGRRGKEGMFFTSNGASYKSDSPDVLPEIEMAPEHAGQIARLLESEITVKVELDIKTKFLTDDLNGYNVIAEIPGTDKNLKSEVVMLGGHLDSWHAATGATDNAAGCAVMMEAVRILKALDVKPKRTIRIALWTGEEQGIHGSRNYVKNHFGSADKMNYTQEHADFSSYFNIDNGTGRIRGIYLQGNEAARPIFESWFKPFDDMIDNTTIAIRNTGGTDHLAFDGVGLPGFQFIQDPVAYGTITHHTNMDSYERLEEEDLKQMAVIVASFVYHASIRDQKLPRKPVATVTAK